MISRYLSRIAMPLAAASLLLAACGGAAAPSATATPTTAAATAARRRRRHAGAKRERRDREHTWTVSDTSKATVSVREQLVGVNLPSDAVLVAKGATGTFVLNGDGTFSSRFEDQLRSDHARERQPRPRQLREERHDPDPAVPESRVRPDEDERA